MLSNFVEYQTFTIYLYLIGLFGIVYNQKNFLITMLNIEMLYLAIITSLLFLSANTSVYGLVLLVTAASESVIGLGLLIILFHSNRSIDFTSYQELRN